jgi:hypothetical protein
MVQADRKISFQLISADEHPCSSEHDRLGSLSAESGKMPDFLFAAVMTPLDFLRGLRIKNAVEVLCIIRCWVFCG